jgi:YD repeat-containing protein
LTASRFSYAAGTSRTLYYRYDLAGRLYGVKLNSDTVATYAYDPNGNRIAINRPTFATDSATYDEQDRLLSFGYQAAGYTRYTFTAAGELLSKAVGPDGVDPISTAHPWSLG